MCGLFGWIGHSPEHPQDLWTKASEILKHRGPDDSGFKTGKNWGLGFRRLSILDLSLTGHQPMSSKDGKYWIVLNGEIFNYLELKESLRPFGHAFKSTSDTEVLLFYLSHFGPAAIPKLNGMFSFVFIDTINKKFIMARDRFGKKPLYLRRINNQIRFASELKGLLIWPDSEKSINENALLQFFGLGYIPQESVIFNGYEKLPQAHYIIGSLDHPEDSTVVPYWNIEIQNEESAKPILKGDMDIFQSLLSDATKIRMRSDVPVGIFLSGGIDSGLVAACSVLNNNNPLKAFTVSYSDSEYDESKLASETALHLHLPHEIIPVEPLKLASIDNIMWFFDEPFGDVSALPTFSLCKSASEYATVFLSGDGGDETFAGYERYRRALKYFGFEKIPISGLFRLVSLFFPVLSWQRYRFSKAGLPDSGAVAAFDGIPEDPAVKVVLHPDLKASIKAAGSPLWNRWNKLNQKNLTARQQMLDYQLYLPDDILVKVDRASMASSIEVRSPFLDYRIVEWAAQFNRSSLINRVEGKLPLRMMAERMLPWSVRSARKRGFGVPVDAWFRQSSGIDFLKNRLLDQSALARHVWTFKGVMKLIEMHQNPEKRDFSFLLWRMLVFDAWARHYLDHR